MSNNDRGSWYTDMFGAGGQRKYPTRPTNPQTFQQTNPNTRQARGLPQQDMTPFYNDGVQYQPTGKPDEWQEMGWKTPDAQVDTNNFLAGWDYQNPPTDPNTGRPLDYNGNPLPDGATGFTPYGEPDFTPEGRNDLAASFEGWFKGIQYRLYQGVELPEGKNPAVAAAEKAASFLEKGNFSEGLPAAWDFLMNIGPGLRALQGEEGAPTAATMTGRTIAEVGRGIGTAFNLFAKTAESLIGTGQLTQKQLAEGSPLPEINFPDWVPGWAETLANTVTPLAAYNSLRVLTAPKKSWDEITDTVAENWQASRIAFSLINDDNLKDEYIRRYKAGEDPRYLAMELENPLDEMVGQLIFDPLNVAGFFTKSGAMARRLDNIEDVFLKPTGKLDEAFRALKADNLADGVGSLQNLAQAMQDEVRLVGKNLDDLAVNRGLLQLTTTGKRNDLANRAGQMIRFIFANTRKAENGAYDFDKAMEIMRGMINMADPNNLDNVAAAINDVVKGAPVPRPLFSRAGLEFAVTMRNMLEGETDLAQLPGIGRGLDFENFLRGFEEAKAGGLEEVLSWATNKMNRATEGYFPTVLEQAAAAEKLKNYTRIGEAALSAGEKIEDVRRAARFGEVSELTRFIANFDSVTKGKIYTPINRFFANVYMGMSPGFAFRNLMNNALTIAVDAGPGSIFVGKETAVNGVKQLLGGLTNPRLSGFGDAAKGLEGVQDAEKGLKWYQFGLRASENFEELGAAQVSYKAVKDVMRQILQPGKALPDITPLVQAGLPAESANLLSRLVVEFDGNVNNALVRFRELASTGNIDVTKTLAWLNNDDIRIAQNFNKWNEVKAVLTGEGTVAEKQTALRQLITNNETFADLSKTEMTGLTDMVQGENREFMATAMNAAKDGMMTDAEAGIVNHRIWANTYTKETYEELIRTLREDAFLVMERDGDLENAQKLREILQPIQERLPGVWSEATSAHHDYTRLVVARSNEIKKGANPALASLWEELQLEGSITPNLGKQELLDTIWNHWRNVTRDRFATAREAYVALAEAGWQEVQRVTGYEPSQALLDKARNYWQTAKAYDDALITTTSVGPMVFQKRDMILSAIGKGDTAQAIRLLADHYGIPTATATGAPLDNVVNAILAKHGGVGREMTLEDVLTSTNKLPTAWQDVIRWAASDMLDELKTAMGPVQVTPSMSAEDEIAKLIESDNPVFYKDLYQQGLKNKTTFENALKRIIEGRDTSDNMKYLRAIQEKVYERLNQMREVYPELDNLMKGKGEIYQRSTLEEVVRAFEERRAAQGKTPLIKNLDEYLGTRTRNAPVVQEPLLTKERITGASSQAANAAEVVAKGYDYRLPSKEIADATGLPEDVVRNWQAEMRYKAKKNQIAQEVSDKTRLYVLTTQAEKDIKGAAMRFSASLKEHGLTRENVYALVDPERLVARAQGSEVLVAEKGIIPPLGKNMPSGAPIPVEARGTLPPEQAVMPGFQNASGLTIGPDGKPIPLPTPYMDGSMPTGPRATAENQAGFKRWIESLADRLQQNTGKLVPVGFDDDIEKAIGAWGKQAASQIAEGRLMASAYADLMRDFALHDYGAKKNLDLVAAYIFPYEFWYTRTYKNWLTRLVTNPETIAAYAKYRTALEKIHAGAPDWWKYNINSNELLGRNDDSPLFFNLEATLNPLNGLLGVDFNDPAKRVDWLSRTVDDLGKFGPSTWTPINVAVALSLYAKGETDAAARWAGRLFPQTAQIRTIGAIFNQNIEVDPFVQFFSQGQDPYEQKRAATALAALVEGTYINGEWVQISQEQAIEAANPTTRTKNPEAQAIWDQATQYALDRRTLGTLSSYFLGVGFKGRNTSELAVDRMYADYYKMWNTSSMLSPDQFKQEMDRLHSLYPWMDAILLAKKSGPEVDRALAYNVLGRVPPGQSGDILTLFGLSDAQMAQFYENKGDLSFMTPTDRDRFMAGIIELGAALALPADATRAEWTETRNRYNAMQEQAKAQFGENVWDRVSDYFMLQKANPDAAKLFLANNPMVEQALSWREEAVMSDNLLFDYYGGIDFLEKYWTGQMYDAAQKQFGTGIFDVSAQYGELADQEAQLLDTYYRMKDANDPNAQNYYKQYLDKDSNQKDLFLKAHPELKNYWALKRTYQDEITQRLIDFEPKLRDVGPELRPDYQPQGVYEIPAAQELGYQFPAPPTYKDYAQMFTPAQERMFLDYVNSGTLNASLRNSLEQMADAQDMTYQELLDLIENAYYQSVAQPQ